MVDWPNKIINEKSVYYLTQNRGFIYDEDTDALPESN